MFRKRLIISFLLLAQLIVLGHSLFMHHHHEEYNSHEHEKPSGSGKHEIDFSHLFSSIHHNGEQITFTNVDNCEISALKSLVQNYVAILPDYILPSEYAVAFQKTVFPPGSFEPYSAFYLTSHGLRGPPSFIVA
ncbi:hypothetical protein [Flavobacterium lindanitolerans]|uniref:hypothetical protein n=1 Tax=Flavobacterium lindanitolerans TaxID=428988 RepID=UPI0023EF8460|nr:hypothetical protein [Flavobacterium lindanitolerans]